MARRTAGFHTLIVKSKNLFHRPKVENLEVDWLVVASHGRLLDGLRHCRVSVASTGHVLARGAVLHRKGSLVDLLASASAHDVHSKNLVRVPLRSQKKG
jgi:hypothetical protein